MFAVPNVPLTYAGPERRNAERRERHADAPIERRVGDRRRGRPPRVPDAEIVRPVIQMTREEWERIKAFADKDRMSRSEFVRLAIEQLMDDTCEALGIAHRIDSDLSKPTTRIWEATKRADLLE
jgi:hypothetical protein